MQPEKHVWQGPELAKTYLEGVRGGIPLAAEQLDLMLRIIRKISPKIEHLLDLGCGDGILGRTVMATHSETRGVFADFSEHMLDEVKQKATADRSIFVHADFGQKDWAGAIHKLGPFNLVLSGFAIHHQPDPQKRKIYRDIFDMLEPGGLFLHLEHVASKSDWAKEAFEEYFIDSLWNYHQKQGGTKKRDEIAEGFNTCAGRAANILAPADLQCQWLEEIGFVEVDCFFKAFELSLFGGRKPQ